MVKCTLAALSHVYSMLNMPDLTKDFLVTHLGTGMVKSTTKSHRLRSNIMSVERYADFFNKWDNETISIKNFWLKCICLLAIATMLRPSDVAPKALFFFYQSSGGVTN